MSPLPMITEVKQKSPHPVKVLQFGQGNFLRAFVCAFIETLNEETGFDGSIVIVKPTARGNLDVFKEQNSLYTVLTRGISQPNPIHSGSSSLIPPRPVLSTVKPTVWR